MLDEAQLQRAWRIVPQLHTATPQLRAEFQRTAFYARIPAGHEVFAQGDPVNALALLISGAVRVYKISDTGREITLYRFSAGESCILSTNAILNQQTFSAIATVEDTAEAIMIPAEAFRVWVDLYPLWRAFVFNLLSARLASVIEIVEEVAFGRMDVRVASLLLTRDTAENAIQMTHQEIAAELGSSREVISRILGHLAEQGFIQLGRGTITLHNRAALADLVRR